MRRAEIIDADSDRPQKLINIGEELDAIRDRARRIRGADMVAYLLANAIHEARLQAGLTDEPALRWFLANLGCSLETSSHCQTIESCG